MSVSVVACCKARAAEVKATPCRTRLRANRGLCVMWAQWVIKNTSVCTFSKLIWTQFLSRNMGLFPPGLWEEGAPQGPTRCAPGAPLLGQYCLLWGESPNMTSPVHHQKPPCAYKHSSRQQHYNPPILDSTQFPQLGRTTNNPHPTLSFPIHNPPIPHDVMIQRQSSPGGLEGAS